MTEENKTAQEMLADYVEGVESGQTIVVDEVTGLTREEIEAEFHILRTMTSEENDKLKKERDDLTDTQQARQRKFLERSWKQARVLLEDENLELLAVLLDAAGLNISDSFNKRCEQVAALQMGYKNDDGKWVVKARRHERIGKLYVVFSNKDWKAKGLAKAIEAAGGTSKLLSEKPELTLEEKARLIRDRKEAMAATSAVIATDAFASKEPAWRLALVSTHRQEVRIHTLLDQKGASVDRYVDAHVKALAAEKEAQA